MMMKSDLEEKVPGVAKANRREEAGQATRTRFLDAAVALLIEKGVARTTTLEVQRRTGTSRGALLHHFPSHADLLAATVANLVRRNEQGASQMRAMFKGVTDPVERAVQTLVAIVSQPSYMAEFELWLVARTDDALRATLIAAERDARKDIERVLAEVFFDVRDRPGYSVVVALSYEFVRGLALSSVLRRSAGQRNQLIGQWAWAARILLDQNPPVPENIKPILRRTATKK